MDRASPSGRVQMDGSRALRASAAWVTLMPRASSSRTTRSCIQGIWPNQALLERDVGGCLQEARRGPGSGAPGPGLAHSDPE